MARYGKPIRASDDFVKWIDKIRWQRALNGIDKKPLSTTKMTQLITKKQSAQRLEEDLLISDLNWDKILFGNDLLIGRKKQTKSKKGSLVDLFLWMIVGFVIVVFFVSWTYAIGVLTTTLQSVPSTEMVNVSYAVENTFVQYNNAMPTLRWISVVMIFAYVISIFISNYFIRTHPIFFGAYLLITIIAIAFSAVLSNSYETVMKIEVLQPIIAEYSGTNWIFLNLPYLTAVIGIFGAIILFANVIINQSNEVSLI